MPEKKERGKEMEIELRLGYCLLPLVSWQGKGLQARLCRLLRLRPPLQKEINNLRREHMRQGIPKLPTIRMREDLNLALGEYEIWAGVTRLTNGRFPLQYPDYSLDREKMALQYLASVIGESQAIVHFRGKKLFGYRPHIELALTAKRLTRLMTENTFQI